MCDFLKSLSSLELTPYNTFLYAALVVGVVKVTTTVLSFTSLLLQAYVLPGVNFAKYGANRGNWAVITGASDGIGKEYAFQLAKKGFNIVLVSRTQSKLETVASEIQSKYKKETKIVAFDASTNAPENYQLLEDSLQGLPVSILINNVGASHSIPVSFLDTTEEEMNQIITLNNIVTLKVTKIVAPLIAANTGKNKGTRGLILTMGSFAGLVPTPISACIRVPRHSCRIGLQLSLENWRLNLLMLN